MRRTLSLENLESRITRDASSLSAQMIYEINRMRNDPQGYVQERQLGIDLSAIPSLPPLAFNAKLCQSAQQHASEMAQLNYLAHQSPVDQRMPNKMARDAGYALPSEWPDNGNHIESIAAGETLHQTKNVVDRWLVDTGNVDQRNRSALLGLGALASRYREIGTGYSFDGDSDFGSYWSMQAAVQNVGDTFLTGFVYDDLNDNGRYEAGEGLADSQVSVGPFQTTTDANGAWSLKIAGGSHRVVVSGSTFGEPQEVQAVVETNNVQVDFRKNDIPQVSFRGQTPWTNPFQRLDVDGNQEVIPLDALLIINQLNSKGIHPLEPRGLDAASAPYYDTNGDYLLAPIDVLLVINYLNAKSGRT